MTEERDKSSLPLLDGSGVETFVYVTTQFPAFHCWRDAPNQVWFLRNPHRHMFHVKATACVSHADRDIEFFMLKTDLEEYIGEVYYGENMGGISCEQIAADLHGRFDLYEVEVSEDGENGSIVRTAPTTNITTAKTCMFVGTEAEGPRRGRATLFVPGSTSPFRLAEAMEQVADSVDGIYYGAGNDRRLRTDTLDQLRAFPDHEIDVECDDNGLVEAGLVACVQYIIVVTNKPHPGSDAFPNVFCKTIDVENKIIKWRRGTEVYETPLDDELFAEDVDLGF